MTKISNNEIAVQKLNEGTTIKSTEMVCEEIDLHFLYPTNRSQPLKCSLCSKTYAREKFKKHFMESHGLMLKKSCDKCKQKFVSPTGVVDHICPESAVE